MGTRIFVSEDGLELSQPLTDAELKHIESIKDGWGGNAFSAEGSDYVVFRLTEMEGADPGTDGIDKPLKELLEYLEEEGITAKGEIFINSDHRDYYYDNTALSVKEDYTIEYEDLALRNMDSKTLIEELKRRGYEEPIKREEISTVKISDEPEDKLENTEQKDAEAWYKFDGFDDKGVITDFIGKHLQDFVGYDPYGSPGSDYPYGSDYSRACDEMEEYVNNLSDDEVKELATKILTEEEHLYCENGKIIDDREIECERE